jgi:predicted aspartyl protease
LWDTGAMCSAISDRAVRLLHLVPISKTTIGHATGQSVVNVYIVTIVLPNNIHIPFVTVIECPFVGFDVLIGMDIITQGDFSISNKDNKTTFSFRIPSYSETDFVAEYNKLTI